MTQQELAGDHTRAYVSAIENGKILPRLDVLLSFTNKLGIDIGVLLAPGKRRMVSDEDEED